MITKLCVVTANHLRENVLRLYCEGIERLRRQSDIEIISIIVGDENSVTQDYDCIHIPYPNTFVTDRFNAGFIAAKEYSPSHVMIMGSDNIFSIEILNEMSKHDSNFMGVRDILFIACDGKHKGQCIYLLSSVIGCCRVMSADLLDKVMWTPFNRQANRSIDSVMYRRLEPFFVNPYIFIAKDIGGEVLDLKTEFNINTFDRWDKCPRTDTNEHISFLSNKERELLSEMLK